MNEASLLVVVFITDMSQYKTAALRIEQELQFSATVLPVLESAAFSTLPAFLRSFSGEWVMFLRFNDSLVSDFRKRVYPLLAECQRSDGVAVIALRSLPVNSSGIRNVDRIFEELLSFNSRGTVFGEWICDRLCAYELWSWAARQSMSARFPGQELQAMELLLGLCMSMRVGFIYVEKELFSIHATDSVSPEFLNNVRRFFIHIWMGLITI